MEILIYQSFIEQGSTKYLTPEELFLYVQLRLRANVLGEVEMTMDHLHQVVPLRKAKRNNHKRVKECIEGLIEKGVIVSEEQGCLLVFKFTYYEEPFDLVPVEYVKPIACPKELAVIIRTFRFQKFKGHIVSTLLDWTSFLGLKSQTTTAALLDGMVDKGILKKRHNGRKGNSAELNPNSYSLPKLKKRVTPPHAPTLNQEQEQEYRAEVEAKQEELKDLPEFARKRKEDLIRQEAARKHAEKRIRRLKLSVRAILAIKAAKAAKLEEDSILVNLKQEYTERVQKIEENRSGRLIMDHVRHVLNRKEDIIDGYFPTHGNVPEVLEERHALLKALREEKKAFQQVMEHMNEFDGLSHELKEAGYYLLRHELLGEPLPENDFIELVVQYRQEVASISSELDSFDRITTLSEIKGRFRDLSDERVEPEEQLKLIF